MNYLVYGKCLSFALSVQDCACRYICAHVFVNTAGLYMTVPNTDRYTLELIQCCIKHSRLANNTGKQKLKTKAWTYHKNTTYMSKHINKTVFFCGDLIKCGSYIDKHQLVKSKRMDHIKRSRTGKQFGWIKNLGRDIKWQDKLPSVLHTPMKTNKIKACGHY